MINKRFKLEQWSKDSLYFYDDLKQTSAHMGIAYICGKVEKKLNELAEENEQLRQQLQEKQEEEQLYANEIVKLNKEVKDNQFLQLGNDY